MARSFSLKSKIFSVLLKTGGSRCLKPVFIFIFNHLGNIMSDRNLLESRNWRAFYHHKPLYPLHVLILPKSSVVSLMEAPKDSAEFYSDLFIVVKKLIDEFNLEHWGYRLITNGGPNQSFPQWHWHLISENFGDISD